MNLADRKQPGLSADRWEADGGDCRAAGPPGERRHSCRQHGQVSEQCPAPGAPLPFTAGYRPSHAAGQGPSSAAGDRHLRAPA